jgi:hypothetical protein
MDALRASGACTNNEKPVALPHGRRVRSQMVVACGTLAQLLASTERCNSNITDDEQRAVIDAHLL